MKVYFTPSLIDFRKIGFTESKRLVSVLWYRYRQYIPIDMYSPCFRLLSGNMDFHMFTTLANQSKSFKELIYRERLINSNLKTSMSFFK